MKKIYNSPATEVILIRSTREMMLFDSASMPNDNFKNEAPTKKTEVFYLRAQFPKNRHTYLRMSIFCCIFAADFVKGI